MKIELIAPYSMNLGLNLNNVEFLRFFFGPNTSVFPILPALPTLAALTPDEFDVKITDENIESIQFDDLPDLVGISFFTQMANRAYEIADAYKERDVKVVLGGVHASALPEEAIQHADSVVIGEAEETWPKLLNDFKKGKLQQFYKNEQYPDISKYPMPRWDLTQMNKYNLHIIQTTRGCPYDCEFCSVKAIFGPQYRYRTEEQIYAAVDNAMKTNSLKPVFFCDDNFIGNKKRAKKLIEGLPVIKGGYGTQMTLDLAQDDELLQLMAEKNFVQVFIGFETIAPDNVKKMGKARVLDPGNYHSAIKHIQSYGIKVVGSFIVGLDYDTRDSLLMTKKFIKESSLLKLVVNIATPYPGTKYYKRLEAENRVLSKDWSRYSSYEMLIKHPNFAPRELEKIYHEMLKEIYTYENIFERIKRVYTQWNSKGIMTDRIEPLINNLGGRHFADSLNTGDDVP